MIDDVRLHDLQLIMKDDFSELIEIFIEDSISRSDVLKSLLAESPVDSLAVKNNAHTLKGSSSNLFATKLQELYMSLEQMAGESNLDEVSVLMSQIEKETFVVFDELKTFNSKLNL